MKTTLTSRNLSESFGNKVKLEKKGGRYALKVKLARKEMM
jgi:hypothetical protein